MERMWDRPQPLMWLANLLIVIAVLIFFYAAVWFGVHSSLFPLRQVEVKGKLNHVTQQQLEYVVQHELTGTFFTLSVAAIRDAFNKLPWVKEVSVHRRWPDKLEVVLKEHHVLGRWRDSGLIDRNGEYFVAASNENLPTFEGPEGSEKEMAAMYLRVKEILAPLGKVPTHLWLSPRRAWKVALDKEMVVEVGRDYVNERLLRFASVYPYSLGKLNSHKVEYVDLRYANGFAVKLPSYQPKGKDT
jgi:cell division protein FtsQ